MSVSFRAGLGSIAVAGNAMAPHAVPPVPDANGVLRAAHRLASILRAAADPTQAAALFVSSGLGTMNVPQGHHGPNLSFETIAHAVRIVSEADRAAGEALRQHLLCVAAIGFFGGPDQQAELFALALRGLRFGRPGAGAGNTALRLVQQADGLVVEGLPEHRPSAGALPPDLLPVRVRDDRNRAWLAIVDAEAVSAKIDDGSATVIASRRRLLSDGADNGLENERPMEAIRLLLRAAVDTGLAGRAVADRIARLRDAGSIAGRAAGTDAIKAVGGLRLKLDAAVAMLEKAGRTVDRAVIRPTGSSVTLAQVAAAGVRILATELLSQAGVPRQRVSVLRTRRVGRPDPVRSRYALLGEFYLNGVSPPHAPG